MRRVQAHSLIKVARGLETIYETFVFPDNGGGDINLHWPVSFREISLERSCLSKRKRQFYDSTAYIYIINTLESTKWLRK